MTNDLGWDRAPVKILTFIFSPLYVRPPNVHSFNVLILPMPRTRLEGSQVSFPLQDFCSLFYVSSAIPTLLFFPKAVKLKQCVYNFISNGLPPIQRCSPTREEARWRLCKCWSGWCLVMIHSILFSTWISVINISTSKIQSKIGACKWKSSSLSSEQSLLYNVCLWIASPQEAVKNMTGPSSKTCIFLPQCRTPLTGFFVFKKKCKQAFLGVIFWFRLFSWDFGTRWDLLHTTETFKTLVNGRHVKCKSVY